VLALKLTIFYGSENLPSCILTLGGEFFTIFLPNYKNLGNYE